MLKAPSTTSGFSLVEVLLAAAAFALLITAFVGSLIYGQQSTALAGARSRAVILAEEGLEATRNIRDGSFSNLTDGQHGLVVSGNQWIFSGTSDTVDIFTRQIVISPVDANRKNVTTIVNWQQNPQRTGSVSATTYLTNWTVSTPVVACDAYCQTLGSYSTGTCRQNTAQCTRNGETYESGGNSYCTGGPSADTCCCKI